MSSALSRLAGSLLDLLLPLQCAVCNRGGRFLCEGCEPALPKLERPYCAICAHPGPASPCSWCASTAPAMDGIRAPYLMDGQVSDMIHALKYQNLRAGAPALGRLLARYLESKPMDAELLVPVPLHPHRERKRGYNQSELLARELGKLVDRQVDTRLLRRTKDTLPQVSLGGHEERKRNIEGAFECVSDVAGQHILLIDDVVTTGSTISAAAAALKDSGAKKVWGLALARQPLVR